MNKLVNDVEALIAELEKVMFAHESIEWYLVNNLHDYLKILREKPNSKAIGDASRALSRFCTDSLDWDTAVYKTCSAIASEGHRIAKIVI
jgi:hypothetical protein